MIHFKVPSSSWNNFKFCFMHGMLYRPINVKLNKESVSGPMTAKYQLFIYDMSHIFYVKLNEICIPK